MFGTHSFPIFFTCSEIVESTINNNDDPQCSSATHVVYPKGHEGDRKEDAADDAVHVSAEWLEKSIKGKKMLDCAPFEV